MHATDKHMHITWRARTLSVHWYAKQQIHKGKFFAYTKQAVPTLSQPQSDWHMSRVCQTCAHSNYVLTLFTLHNLHLKKSSFHWSRYTTHILYSFLSLSGNQGQCVWLIIGNTIMPYIKHWWNSSHLAIPRFYSYFWHVQNMQFVTWKRSRLNQSTYTLLAHDLWKQGNTNAIIVWNY